MLTDRLDIDSGSSINQVDATIATISVYLCVESICNTKAVSYGIFAEETLKVVL